VRARNIKPATFTNELLAFAAPIHTVIFAGLWCIADRRGVLLDSPHGIHILINPGRSHASTRNALSWLAANGFIVRYEVENTKLIKILKFDKHQNPHRDERASELPDYGASTMPAPCQHHASTILTPGKAEPPRLIPSSLIPDSGSLIPDPPHMEHRAAPGKRGGGVGRGMERRSWNGRNGDLAHIANVPFKTADELEQDELEREEAARAEH
jgi:hypothetical protein